ncbi:MAG: type II toxin-antitoxin system RatA family toxin [Pseudomonadota bacterium]
MPTHSETRHLPYTAQQMYDLVADVERYPEFLPWTAAARIRSTRENKDSVVMLADLVISFKVFRERFGSRVTLYPEQRKIDVAYLDGPFRYLDNHWHFKPISETRCEVDFFVDFEFKSRAMQMVIGAVFNQAMQRIVRAFEKRAEALYRPSRAVAPSGTPAAASARD